MASKVLFLVAPAPTMALTMQEVAAQAPIDPHASTVLNVDIVTEDEKK